MFLQYPLKKININICGKDKTLKIFTLVQDLMLLLSTKSEFHTNKETIYCIQNYIFAISFLENLFEDLKEDLF